MSNPVLDQVPAVSPDEKRALLAERLRRASERQTRRLLSFAQERMWFLHQLEPDSPLYNVPLAARLSGTLNEGALEKALRRIVGRHEALRTRIDGKGEEAMQITLSQVEFSWRVIEVREEAEADRWIGEEARRPFDLTGTEALLRAALIRISPTEHILALNVHHIAADEWSLKILFRELAEFYAAELEGRAPRLSELPIQYADYAAWQRQRLNSLQRQIEYWKERLGGKPAVTEFMTDRPRGKMPTVAGGVVTRRLREGLGERLRQVGSSRNATLFMVLLAGFAALVRRYTGVEDVIVGAPVAGRNRMETEGLIGFFVNTLLLRTNLAGDPKFEELLQRVRATALGAFENQEAPFEKVIEALHPERSLRQLAFTNVMFALQARTTQSAALPGLEMEWRPVETGTAKFDLTLVMVEEGRDLTAHIEYNSDLFDRGTIERLMWHYENLLEGAVANPAQCISELPLLSEVEKTQVLTEWNDNATDYPRTQCIPELFEARALEQPKAVALVFGGEPMTYGELNARANRLAHFLIGQGIKAGDPVAICVERSADMVVGMLATLKAGGAYAPIDPSYPKERQAFMLADTGASILLTQRGLAQGLARSGVMVVCVDAPSDGNAKTENPPNRVAPDDLAYIIYTSGSTGQPKGVAVTHRGVTRLVLKTNYIALDAMDRIAQVSNIAFDAATFEVWGALLNGGQLRGITSEVALSPRDFERELREQGITAMFLTSALFSQVAAEVPEAFATMRTLMAGGEALDPKAVRAVLKACPGVRLVNGYGPTENTTFTCCALLQEVAETATNVPIGKPISNTQVYILDANRQLVPSGAPGELYTGGDGLARGYWNRADLTEEKFVSHQFSKEGPVVRLYRTGDLARWLPDGNVEFLGRLDNQVKVRGFRVELGEIEAVLGRNAAVRECAVKVSGADRTRLIAYVVPADRKAAKPNSLRAFLSERLPEYMVPSAFVQIEALPLSHNGKVDRTALPEPDQGRVLERKYAAPRDAIEAELTRIWENVLGARLVGIEDNFFELGGHSLLAARVAARAEQAFGKKVRLATVFMSPTIEKLASTLRDEMGAGGAAGASLVELQGTGSKPPLFLAHGAGGGMFWGYVNLAQRLGLDQPVYGFGSRGMDGRTEFGTIEEMASHYVSEMRAKQPQGPYYLGGYCFGGNVAFEMARQLEAGGEKVALLVLLNCAPPNSGYMRPRWTPEWAARFARNLFYWLDYCRQWTPEQRRGFLRWKWARLKHGVADWLAKKATDGRALDTDSLIDLSSVPEPERELWQTHIRALMAFQPRRYGGQAHLFRSPGHPLWCSFEPDYGWGELAREVKVTIVAGAHEKILEEPWVDETAAALKRTLDERQAVAPVTKPTEEEAVLAQWNATEKEYPRDKTLFDLFAEQAGRTPEAEALICGVKRLTFRELAERAAQVATRLRALGVEKEGLVGICLERSEDLVSAILGTLQAGAAYVPLDPAYPKARLAFIVEHAKLRALVTREKLRDALPTTETPVLSMDDVATAESGSGPKPICGPDNLAYVLYTSGSTGNPKGVAIEHRSAVAFVSWARDVFTREELSGVLASTSICFDLSIFELFVPLCAGGKVILADNALGLPGLPAANEVTLINTVPSAIRELLRIHGVTPSVQVVNLAGEPLATALVDQIYNETAVKKVYDLYGPTETTTYSTYTLREAGAAATIGRPLANEQVYILDEQMRPARMGEPGDLYIGGAGLARGYLNRPDLTAERFARHPFLGGARLYKTGDIARWREDGNLIYMGRSDHQVKIRGFRIELSEIETALKGNPAVAEAVVIGREDSPGEKRLAAYVVSHAGRQQATIEELRRAVKEKLPDYMMPAAFVFLPKLPLTPNGKVDRLALPAPKEEARAASRDFAAPRDGRETDVAAIWAEVLGVRRIGALDDFFELGGHSLLAIQVVARLRFGMGVEAPLTCLYDYRTVRALAAAVESGRWPVEDTLPRLERYSENGPAPASLMQEQLWFMHQLAPDRDAYNVPSAFRLKGPLDRRAWQSSFDKIVGRHEALRTTLHFENGQLTQVVAGPRATAMDFTELLGADEGALSEAVLAEARRPFDLERGPLFRVKVFSVSPTDHAVVLVMDHAISDGWSLDVLYRELETNYCALANGLPAPESADLPIQFSDYARWQRRWLQAGVEEREGRHWTEKLAGAQPTIALPHDKKVSEATHDKAGRRGIVLEAALRRDLAALAQREGGTIFMALMTGLAVTLQKWTGQTDMTVGTVVAGRSRRETEGLIGCFMNFLPLRLRITGTETGEEALRAVKSEALDAQSHAEFPFEKIVEAAAVERRAGEPPLYNVALLLQNRWRLPQLGKDLATSAMATPLETALLDLRFEANETAEGLEVQCDYKAELFNGETIEHLLASLRAVLEALARDASIKLDEIKLAPLLTKQEARVQRVVVASTFTAEPVEEPLRYWLDELGMAGEIEFAPFGQVFQQLLDPGSALATNARGLNVILIRLSDWHTNAGTGLNLKRNADEFVRAMEAAAGRGGALKLVCFCPPPKTISENQALALTEIESALASALRHLSGVQVVTTGQLDALYPVAAPDDPAGDDLGKIPYTAEFFTALATLTARKLHAAQRPTCKVIALDCDQTLWGGVCGEDGAAGVRLDAARRALQEFMRRQQAAGRLLALCSKNDEADVRAVFEQRTDMPLRQEHFAAARVNWQAKSENLRELAQELNLGLDSFVLLDDNPLECAEVEANCPEALALQLPEDPALIPQFLEHCWVFDQARATSEDKNRTEMYRQERDREQLRTKSMSFADFIAGLELEVEIAPAKDEELERVAQLTQRTNQFNVNGKRRTEGDLRKPSGLETLAVSVKDRFGDYGLVGAALFETKGAEIAVDGFLLSCRALGRGVEHRMLAALGRLAEKRGAEWVAIPFERLARNQPARDFLENVGAAFKKSDEGIIYRFPAKVAAEVAFDPNRAALKGENAEKTAPRGNGLPKFTQCRTVALESGDAAGIYAKIEARKTLRPSAGAGGYAAPRTETERRLVELWQKLLRLEKVGIQDDFFRLGGHSMLAVRLFAEVEKITGKRLPLVTVFQAPTIAALAAVIDSRTAEPDGSTLEALQPNGSKPPLYLVHGAGGDVLWGYANMLAHMERDQPIYVLKASKREGEEEFQSLETMAARYLEAVRAHQPRGPYYLGGYCFGGNVAYEMARQLEEAGEKVGFVALLDAAPTNAGYETVRWWRPDFIWLFARNLGYWLRDFKGIKPEDRRRFLRRKYQASKRKVARWFGGTNDPAEVDLEEVIDPNKLQEHELNLWKIHLRALAEHRQREYSGGVTLFRTAGHPVLSSYARDLKWGGLVSGGVTVNLIPGSHENIFIEPNVKALAAHLTAALDQAQRNGSEISVTTKP